MTNPPRPSNPLECIKITNTSSTAGPDGLWLTMEEIISLPQVVQPSTCLEFRHICTTYDQPTKPFDPLPPPPKLQLRVALRETQHGGGLRKRLGEMRDLSTAGPEGLWLTMEETINEICGRQGSLAYGEALVEYFKSQNAALDAFK